MIRRDQISEIVPRAKNGKPLTVDVTLYVIKIVDMAETRWV